MDARELISPLDSFQRRVVTLVYFRGNTQARTAEILAVEPPVVRATLAQALRRVARYATVASANDRN